MRERLVGGEEYERVGGGRNWVEGGRERQGETERKREKNE